MKRRRRVVSVVLLALLLLYGWWLLTRTPHPQATIGHFGENKFLCVRPGQLIRLSFSEPLPSGIVEAQKELNKEWRGSVQYANPEAAAETRYWGSLYGLEWQIISDREILIRVPENQYGPLLVKYPTPHTPTVERRFEFMLFITGDSDVDRIIQSQEPLPADGEVPSKGNVAIYYKEPSLWQRLRFWLYIEAVWRRGWQIRL